MGYCVHQSGGKFGIQAKHIDAALWNVCQATPAYPKQDSIESIKKSIEDFDFLPSMSKLKRLVYHGWGFKLKSDEEGDIVGVSWEWEKMPTGNIIQWMHAVVPYVPAGCFIEMCGEDGERWRYVFNGYNVEEKHPKVVWED